MDQHGNPISTYSAVIEWRHGKKQRGGWPHYRATVIFVSVTRYEATRKLNALLKENERAELTKRVPVRPQKYQDDPDDSDPDDTLLTQSLHVKKSKDLTRKDPAEEFLAMYSDSPPSVIHNVKSLPKTVVELKREIQDLKEENANLRELLVQDVPELLKTMKNVIDLAEPPKRSSSELTTPRLPPQSSPQSRSGSSSADSLLSLPRSSPSSSTSESVIPSSKMEIHPGTGVMVEKLAWAYAVNANSATVFVRHLLTAVFPVEILLVSNLRGGKRGRGDARLPLDKRKLDAIYSATLERWPGTQPSSIGSTINAKITELRAKSKIVSVTTPP
ncbi:unnamed protein product [Pleuronectes platessa]|uniref:BEN domain-containing protein n=1 Tax=Pleuronectes platessa TaxID=8262 RepID=A0A9N7UY44_PLEPL|nr:unnamed protein product [Pleuronectes platessa]